ncbi:hypothetical protein GOODEAATRI_001603 [Goodea atripinnis]|uniref:Uncharacterized protein n=1 Tax=Goodea atripinnis TaxID=208336 RepID=A0ABV0N714_9TELE
MLVHKVKLDFVLEQLASASVGGYGQDVWSELVDEAKTNLMKITDEQYVVDYCLKAPWPTFETTEKMLNHAATRYSSLQIQEALARLATFCSLHGLENFNGIAWIEFLNSTDNLGDVLAHLREGDLRGAQLLWLRYEGQIALEFDEKSLEADLLERCSSQTTTLFTGWEAKAVAVLGCMTDTDVSYNSYITEEPIANKRLLTCFQQSLIRYILKQDLPMSLEDSLTLAEAYKLPTAQINYLYLTQLIGHGKEDFDVFFTPSNYEDPNIRKQIQEHHITAYENTRASRLSKGKALSAPVVANDPDGKTKTISTEAGLRRLGRQLQRTEQELWSDLGLRALRVGKVEKALKILRLGCWKAFLWMIRLMIFLSQVVKYSQN